MKFNQEMLLPFDCEALAEDVSIARSRLFEQHVRHAEDPERAMAELVVQFLLQAKLCLRALSEIDDQTARIRLSEAILSQYPKVK